MAVLRLLACHYFFFFNDTATTEIYTLHIVGSVRCVQETVGIQPYYSQVFVLNIYGFFIYTSVNIYSIAVLAIIQAFLQAVARGYPCIVWNNTTACFTYISYFTQQV
eukprot:TRINITY_DN9897_c0_g1_i2.p2 TRINITY_DN9897_c0_g1~~TRINITY_DN9897_c0_g1_i2.p2  ORF type:complete len:107 (+),score=10.00 TRINITY_DN9897_c0_g1_i2:65-385(+)